MSTQTFKPELSYSMPVEPAAPEPAAYMGPGIGKSPDYWTPLPEDLVAKARVQMDDFAAILEERFPQPVNPPLH